MSTYEYSPIIAREHSFRLVRLHPAKQPRIEISIVHASLEDDNLPSYEAVSYVWGSPQLVGVVYIREKCLQVTNNLELVLRDLRYPSKERWLWIDGICINQSDQEDHEKNHQVRQMGRIYRCARRVLFHLGRPTELTPVIKDTLEKLQRAQELEELQRLQDLRDLPDSLDLERSHITQSDQDRIWEHVSGGFTRHDVARIQQALESILERPWFRRVWIIQEVANAQEAAIHWGPTGLSVRWFVNLVQIFDIKTDRHQQGLLDLMPLGRRDEPNLSSGQDLYELLVRFNGAQTSKSHDNIFALLGMCENGKGQGPLTVDYSKSLESVVCEAIAYMSYCDEADIPAQLAGMDGLTRNIKSLFEKLVLDFTINSKLKSLHSLLLNRGDQITITSQFLCSVVGRVSKPEVICCLLEHAPDAMVVTVEVLERAFRRRNPDVFELLLAQCEQRFPCMEEWYRASKLMAEHNATSMSSRFTLLELAVLNGKEGEVRQLLEELGANMDTETHWDFSPSERKSAGSKQWRRLPPLLLAVQFGRVDIIEILLDCGSNIEATGGRGRTALALAAHNGREDIAHICLLRGANIETKCEDGRTPLSIAAGGDFEDILPVGRSIHEEKTVQGKIQQSRKSEDIIRRRNTQVETSKSPCLPEIKMNSALVGLLLEKGAEVNAADNRGRTPLWWAVNHGHCAAVEKLLKYNAVMDHANDQLSLLSWAIWNGHEDIIARLLAHDAPSAQMEDALEWAIRIGSNSLLEPLIDRCVINRGCLEVVESTFVMAVEEGNTVALQTLVQHPKLVKGSSGMSAALLLAASKGDDRCAEILLGAASDVSKADLKEQASLLQLDPHESGHDALQLRSRDCILNGHDEHGFTPLFYAAQGGHVKTVQVLIEGGVNFNTESEYDGKPLREAAYQGHQDVVRLLLQGGSPVDTYNAQGKTALMWACSEGHAAIVELLLGANADLSIRDDIGNTARDRAMRRGNDQIIKILDAHEGDPGTRKRRRVA